MDVSLLNGTNNYVVFVWRSFLFLWVLGMDYVILLWHSLSLPYNYLMKTLKKRIKNCGKIKGVYLQITNISIAKRFRVPNLVLN